jgi:hypothetical protein
MSTQISDRAIVAIIGWEVGGGRAAYERLCARPDWPGGDSGVTIGVGYDLGYEAQFRGDWSGRLPAPALARLAAVCGITGAAAQAAAARVGDIVVPWDAADAVFRGRMLPRETARTLEAFPGAEALSPDSLGALVSLVFNRGAGMQGDRRREMRDIRDAIAARKFADVPPLIRAMKRLWPTSTDLRDRRDEEALLFAAGLAVGQPSGLTDIG